MDQDAGDQAVIIRNLSRRGLGGSAVASSLVVGTEAMVSVLPDVVVAGTIRWTSGKSFGMELSEDIDPGRIAVALQRQIGASNAGPAWEVNPRHRHHRTESGLPKRRV